MSAEPKWVSKSAVFAIHERLLAEHGGAPGLLDEARLDSALASPRNHFAHGEADLFRLAAAYAYAIARDHPFRDGNKRVALTVAGVFLELNGFPLAAEESEAVSAMVALAERSIDEHALTAWLREASTRGPRRS
ncbi:MAG: type II toxin-antitoxin system death-on-curing family toxin [bacterium]